MHYFKRHDGQKIVWNETSSDFYSNLSEELGVDRNTAKSLFWMVVLRSGLVRLGATAQGVGLGQVTPESSYSYELVGDYVENIVNHYIIERFRLENWKEAQKVA